MKHQFNFSIIMAVYNTESYLKKSIDSVLNQSLDFESNVQLILVDDCSTDSSKVIIEEYKKEYPNNIETIFLEKNSGQWTARNIALNYVKGKYVNFLDSDDYLSPDTLEEVWTFFEKNYDKTDIVSIPLQFFERMTSSHILNKKFTEDRVIDLVEEPNNPQLSASSAFFKEELFDRYEFPTNMTFSEDAFLITKILFEKKTLGVVTKPTYYYRRRADASSTIDNSVYGEDYYISRLENYFIELIKYSLEKEGKVIDYLKYMIAYELQWTLQLKEIKLDDKLKKDKFWELLDYIIGFIDLENITNNKYINNELCKLFFVSLKNKDVHIEKEENNVLLKSADYTIDDMSNHKLWIDIIEIKNDIVKISGFLNSLFNKNQISIIAQKTCADNDESCYYGKYVKYTSRKDVYFLSKHWQSKYNFDIEIPVNNSGLENIKLIVAFHIDGDVTNFNKDNLIFVDLSINFSEFSNLSNISNYLIKEQHILLFQKNLFKVYPYKYKSLIRREMEVLKKIITRREYGYMEAFCLRLLYLIAYPFMLRRNKNIYIFMDRVESGDDNANALFKYANTIKDNNIKYFTLGKDGNNYKETSKIGKMLKYKSFKHKLVYLFTDKFITSHPYQTVINPFYEENTRKHKLFSGLITLDIYFVQHGVTLGNISGWLSKFNKNLSLISTVSEKERDSFLVEGYNYDESIIQILGFPRFDYLENDNQKQILIIPSWRNYLKGNKEVFLKSSYYTHLTELLNNKKLKQLTKNRGYKIIFRAHPELLRYVDEENNERYVDLIDIPENVTLSIDDSYQKLFKESSLMITDFSSVFFDFAYLKKPIIYYQPESSYHYGKSYFDFEKDGYGDLITTETELLDKIEYFIENNCVNEEKYNKRIDEFFKYIDKKNCKRVYEWIKNH